MFTVYAEKETFEHLILYNEQSPNWYKILCNHAEVCLNITDDELIEEEIDGKIIFEFIKANGGRSPIALSDFFDNVYDNYATIAEKPRSAFLLKTTAEEAMRLQDAYGIVVQSIHAIDDSVFRGAYFDEIEKGSIVQNGGLIGWKYYFDFTAPPSNTMIITDDWLFKNTENDNIVGESNVIALADALLPATISVPYHMLIVTDDQGRSKERCTKLVTDIKASVSALRPYDIIVEVVFAETIHKRKVFLNYMSITCDKGFAMFRVVDGKTVRDDNDFRYEKIFHRMDPAEGATVFSADTIRMKQIQNICTSVKQFIANAGNETSNRIILGDHNADYSLKNRLINDV